jgi:hypothetical protein
LQISDQQQRNVSDARIEGGNESGSLGIVRLTPSFHTQAGVSEPVPGRTVQPEYSDAGRKARIEGTVELRIIVNPD